MMLQRMMVLVPKETPAGPPEAREAWADALGTLLVVTAISKDGMDVTFNSPTTGETVTRTRADLTEQYEPAGAEDDFGRSWAATLTRAATEAARVSEEEYGGRESARYWQRVAAVVRRVFREEEAVV